ncbi:MAG: uncharacterized protein K0R98_1302 [Rickettsiaceae bacterium]|jgi:hypothetical protein|nr:uncharacterized protein [Rickettsiaceae bacterium]
MPTTDTTWELQKSAYAALTGDTTLAAMVSGVFSHVPQDTAFPYIKFNNIRSRDWSTKTTSGIEATVQLNVFSRTRGNKESLNIIAEIKRILHGVSLSLTGCTLVSIYFTDSGVAQLSDGITWQSYISFDAFVHI